MLKFVLCNNPYTRNYMKKYIILSALLLVSATGVAMDEIGKAYAEAKKPQKARTVDDILITMNKELMKLCSNAKSDGEIDDESDDEMFQFLHTIASEDLKRLEKKKKKEQEAK